MDVLKNEGEQNEATRAGFGWHVALYIALGIGVLVGAVFFFFWGTFFDRQEPDMTERVQGRFKELNEYLAAAETKKEEAQARRLIAENKMFTSAEAAHRNLRRIILDESLPVEERSLAVLMIGETYFNRSNNTPRYAQRYISVGRLPYQDWFDSSIEDESVRVWDGMKHLYEYSLTFADSPISHYRIALWHLSRGEQEKAEQEYFLGTRAYLAFARELAPQDRHMDGTALWLKGVVAYELGKRLEDPILIGDSRDAFNSAREFLRRQQQEGDNYPAYTTELLWTNLRYAITLARENTTENSVLINELLDELLLHREYAQARGFGGYLKNLGTSAPTVVFYAEEKQAIGELASVHSGFAQMLRELGWTL